MDNKLTPVTVYTIPNLTIRNEVMTTILEEANGSQRDLVEEGWDAAINSLEKKEDYIVLSLEDFEKLKIKIAGDAFDAGWFNGHSIGADISEFTDHDNKKQYLTNLLKQKQ